MRGRFPANIAALLTILAVVIGCGSGGGASAVPPSAATSLGASAPTTLFGAPTATPQVTAASAVPASVLPTGRLTIVALGDSLTEGQGDDSGIGGYPGRLQALMTQIRPGSGVVNLGHSGWSSQDLIDGQNGLPSELEQAAQSKPDVAMVWIGSNDLWNLYEYGPEPMRSGAEQADLQTYKANVERILRELTAHGAAVFIALLDDQSKRPVVADPPNPSEPAFPGTTTADLALMSAHVRAYNDIIRTAAAFYGATAVDFYDTTIFTDPATLAGDGNHPNSAGYDRVVQIWFAALKPLLS